MGQQDEQVCGRLILEESTEIYHDRVGREMCRPPALFAEAVKLRPTVGGMAVWDRV